jgi:hypothetical protein
VGVAVGVGSRTTVLVGANVTEGEITASGVAVAATVGTRVGASTVTGKGVGGAEKVAVGGAGGAGAHRPAIATASTISIRPSITSAA